MLSIACIQLPSLRVRAVLLHWSGTGDFQRPSASVGNVVFSFDRARHHQRRQHCRTAPGCTATAASIVGRPDEDHAGDKADFSQGHQNAAAASRSTDAASQQNGALPKKKHNYPKNRKGRPVRTDVRKKISEAMKGRQRDAEHSRRISEAKTGRPHTLGTRYSMHESAQGRRHTPETRQKISRRVKEAHARRNAAQKTAQPAGDGTRARPTPLNTQQLPQPGVRRGAGLVIEKAVAEMMELRNDIAAFMAAYQREHGFKPALQDTAKSSPELYDKFVRYVALQDYVRNFEDQLGP